MRFQGLATGVAAIFTLFFIHSPCAHAWSEEKCREVVLTGNEYKFQVKTIDEMIQEIETTKIDLKNGEIRSPWEMGMIPNLAARKLGYQYQLELLAKEALGTNDADHVLHSQALDVVKRILSGDKSNLSNLPMNNFKMDGLIHAVSTSEANSELASISAMGACGLYQSWEQQSNCDNALKSILKAMAPVNDITSRGEIGIVLTDPRYQLPLSQLASEYIDKIEKGESIGDRRLDEDLNRVLGSQEMKWNVLAVLAARGANFYMLFDYGSRENYRVMTALAVISSAALYFDSLNRSGEIFSFPRGVHVSCDSGKSYHFWMTAFLAHEYGSKWAAYIAEIGYQKIRLDLAYAAAGAEFGAHSEGTAFNFDINEALDRMEKSADPLKPMSKASATYLWDFFGIPALVRWNKIFHPGQALSGNS